MILYSSVYNTYVKTHYPVRIWKVRAMRAEKRTKCTSRAQAKTKYTHLTASVAEGCGMCVRVVYIIIRGVGLKQCGAEWRIFACQRARITQDSIFGWIAYCYRYNNEWHLHKYMYVHIQEYYTPPKHIRVRIRHCTQLCVGIKLQTQCRALLIPAHAAHSSASSCKHQFISTPNHFACLPAVWSTSA